MKICIRCERHKEEDCWIAQDGYRCWLEPKEEDCPYKLEPSWEDEEIKKRTKKAPPQKEKELSCCGNCAYLNIYNNCEYYEFHLCRQSCRHFLYKKPLLTDDF